MRMWLAIIAPPRRDGTRIAVLHPARPDQPGGLIGKAAHDEGVFSRRLHTGGSSGAMTKRVRRGEVSSVAPPAISTGSSARKAMVPGGRVGHIQPDLQSMPRKHGRPRVVGGEDAVHAQAELAEETVVLGQRRGGMEDVGTDVLHGKSLLLSPHTRSPDRRGKAPEVHRAAACPRPGGLTLRRECIEQGRRTAEGAGMDEARHDNARQAALITTSFRSPENWKSVRTKPLANGRA